MAYTSNCSCGRLQGGERPGGRQQCWCFTADWKYTATYHAGGGGGSSLFVCELFLGHIGYISLKKPKTSFISLSSFFLQKRTKKITKKKCLSGALGGRDVCALTAVFSPCTASFLRGCCKSSRFLSLDLQPEGGTSPNFGGYQAGTQRISRNRGLGTSILVPSLRRKKKWKTSGTCPLPESLQTRTLQQNNHYCLCRLFFFFLSTRGKNCYLLHTGLKSRDLAWERSWNKSGGGTTKTAVQPGPLSHTSSALLSTCLVLQNRHCPSFFLYLFGKKKSSSQSWNRQSGGGELAKLFKRKTGLIMHMLVHIQYTARVHVCIWLDLLYPLSPAPQPSSPYSVSKNSLSAPFEDKIINISE